MAKNKSNEIRKFSQTIRIYDEQMLDYIDELLGAGYFASKNEIVNRAVEYGLPLIYSELFGKKIAGGGPSGNILNTDSGEQIKKDLREMRLTLDELFVIMNIIEYITTTSYNLQRAELNGIDIADDDVQSGIYSQLPQNLQEVKNEILQRQKKNKRS